MKELEEALKKLDLSKVIGQKEKAMGPYIKEVLTDFCRQDGEFAQAVAQGGSFRDCMAAVARGVGGSISDLEACKKAVRFYFPGAEVRVQMTIDLVGEAGKDGGTEVSRPDEPEEHRDGIVLDLMDFL